MIRPASQVHPLAKIDPTVRVGPWCVLGPSATLGKGTKLMSHVVIDGWTEAGEGNTIFPFSVLGSIPQDLKYRGEETRPAIGNENIMVLL